MKKIYSLFLIAFILFSACKYDEKSYSFIREFGPGTYQTKFGVAKYVSAARDTATSVRDIYAIVRGKIVFTKNTQDSIMFFGHCWSTNSNVRFIDSMSTKYFENNATEFTGTFISQNTLYSGLEYTSPVISIDPETNYYITSYVVTGKTENGTVVPRDTAYNPYTVSIRTLQPTNEWKSRENFDMDVKGSVCFTYDGKLYAGLGIDLSSPKKDIYEYNPKDDTWTFYTQFPGSGRADAVAFVIEGVDTQPGIDDPSGADIKDFLYIGCGYTGTESEQTPLNDFYRFDLEEKQWNQMNNLSSPFFLPRRNAIAFSINGKGYVGLGHKDGINNSAKEDMNVFDPENIDSNHPQGTWSQIVLGGSYVRLTRAVCFIIDDFAYVTCGVTSSGNFNKKMWRFQPTETGGTWTSRKDFPGTARIDAVGFNIENLGYVGTGYDGDSMRSDFYRYNPYINNWDQRASYGTPDDPENPSPARPRTQAFGAGLKYADDDFRGYIGGGLTDDPKENNDEAPSYPFMNTFFHFRP